MTEHRRGGKGVSYCFPSSHPKREICFVDEEYEYANTRERKLQGKASPENSGREAGLGTASRKGMLCDWGKMEGTPPVRFFPTYSFLDNLS